MGFDCIIFDLDDTLYPRSSGVVECVKKNIQEFLVDKCGFSESKASILRAELFKTYGSTLAGLRALGYDISHEDYHSFVHGRLPYDDLIKPDAHLGNLLRCISVRKLILTNSDKNHAETILDRLGIKEYFDQIICFETMNPNLSYATTPDEFPVLLKPSLDAFKIALRAANVLDPQRTLFLDDSARNIAAAKLMGLQTILVGNIVKCKGADYAVESVNHLPQVIPQIWAMDGRDQRRKKRSMSECDIKI